MQLKQSLYWLLFSVIGFGVLINFDPSSMTPEPKQVLDFGPIEIFAAILILLIWIWLTRRNNSTQEIRNELNLINDHMQNQRITEAQSLWPELERKASQILAERDPLFLTYQALRMQVVSTMQNQSESMSQAFNYLNRSFRAAQKWDELVYCTLNYVDYLESIGNIETACEILENFHDHADKRGFSCDEATQKLERLHNLVERT